MEPNGLFKSDAGRADTRSMKLTPHQSEVFDRLARQATSPRGFALEENLGSHSGCFHLVRKGVVSSFEQYGPRGGTKYRFQLTEAGVELARKRGVLHSSFEQRAAAMGGSIDDINAYSREVNG
jgi:hypothetical protein